MQFHYPKVKCTYNTSVNNDYYSTDSVGVGWWRGQNVHHLQFWEGLLSPIIQGANVLHS